MPQFNFPKIVNDRRLLDVFDVNDFEKWRVCFEGGRIFRDQYLERFNDRETEEEFKRRRSLTPIPGYARKEINGIKNSISARFPDILRRGGSKKWREAVNGNKRGVDLRGTGMNSFLNKQILADLLVIGQVGVLVDAPKTAGPRQIDVPPNFRPYLRRYRIEDYGTPIPADPQSPSDWSAVLLENRHLKPKLESLSTEEIVSFTLYFLDDNRSDLLTIQKLDETGTDQEPPFESDLDSIPFVVYDIQDSFMRNACSYEIVLLNMISADSSYVIDSNFPILTKMRSGASAAAHLDGSDNEQEVGARKGIYYERDEDRPGFIGPPTGQMKASLEFRRELKSEIHDLIAGIVTQLGDDGTVEAGLAAIGNCLEDGENRTWDHWAAFEATNPDRRNLPLVSYPDDWSLKSDSQRMEEADQKLNIMNKLPGRKAKKQAAKGAIESLWRGKIKSNDLDAMTLEIDQAPYTTSDPDILDKVAERNLAGPQTLSMAYGFEKNEFKKGQEERDRKVAAQQTAQRDAMSGTAMGLPEGSIDDNSNKEGREADVEKAKLDGNPGVRGDEN